MPPVAEDSLLVAIRADLAASPFRGEGHRKVWARLQYGLGLVVGRNRVLRLTCDECGYRRFYLRDGVEDLAIDDLLLEGAEEPFGHAVGFRLVWEEMAERDAPVGDLAGEVAGDVLRPILCPHSDMLRFARSA